ncbi:MAG: ethanolamine ammonia-lyase, small subunit, partial [Bacillota bacterium]|nr:ethanolamine ammonia-lyase, small subunit [Bacillota bacterium]
MSMEDNIKLIVEQVLKEIAVTEAAGSSFSGKNPQTAASADAPAPWSQSAVSSPWGAAVGGASGSSPWNSVAGGSVYDDTDAEDLSTVDLQTQLLVPNPKNKDLYLDMKQSTSARIGVWRAGPRPLTQTLLRFRADHAVAQDSVMGEIAEEDAAKYNMIYVKSECRDKDEYLTRPELGRVLDEDSIRKLEKECERKPQVQILVADGLSSKAMEANIPDLYPAM